MSRYTLVHFKIILAWGAVALAFTVGVGTSLPAKADSHLFSLKKIFSKGKCAPVAPNYELLIAGFAGGEISKYKITDKQGRVVEVISTLVNKQRDQWVIVGSKTERKVIFCLYASGSGSGSAEHQAIK